MKSYLKQCIFPFLALLFGFLSVSLEAQYVIQQKDQTIPVNYDLLPEDSEFQSFQEEALYFLEQPDEVLSVAGTAGGEMSTAEISTVYISGENLAIEAQNSQGRITTISDGRNGNIYQILWDSNVIIEFTPQEIQSIQDEARRATEEMLKTLPPAQQKALRDEMENSQQTTFPAARATGKKASISGMQCEQFLIEGEDEVILIWATASYAELASKIRAVSGKLESSFQFEQETNDPWQLLKDLLPVEIRAFTTNMDGEPVIKIETIFSIVQKDIPAKKFDIPDNFSRKSMKDLMKENFGNSPGE